LRGGYLGLIRGPAPCGEGFASPCISGLRFAQDQLVPSDLAGQECVMALAVRKSSRRSGKLGSTARIN
jgi:hypothetical protein